MCGHRSIATDEHVASIRQIYSFRQIEVDLIIGELGRSSVMWEIDRHDDCDGDVMLICTPTIPDAITFVLNRTISGVQLAVAEGDMYETRENFDTITAAIQAVRSQTEAGIAPFGSGALRRELAGRRR